MTDLLRATLSEIFIVIQKARAYFRIQREMIEDDGLYPSATV